MNSTPYRTITAGRTLFNCSKVQFDQFLDPDVCVPRAGLLKQALQQLHYEIVTIGGLFHVHDEGGNRVAESARTERQALTTWWRKTGLQAVTEQRGREREWERMNSTGRPVLPSNAESKHYIDRSKQRENAMMKLESVWLGITEVITRHSAQADVWLQMSIQRDLPRPNNLRKVSLNRTLAMAVAALYEVDGLNQTFREYFNDGREVLDTEVLETLHVGLDAASCACDVAGCMPRIALTVALQLSPEPPQALFQDLRNVLTERQILNVDDLKVLIDLALGR